MFTSLTIDAVDTPTQTRRVSTERVHIQRTTNGKPTQAAPQTRVWVVRQARDLRAAALVDARTPVLTSINEAAQLAQPGDTILVHGGIYRERIAPARAGEKDKPITYLAAPGETVIVRGSEVLSDWKPVPGQENLYRHALNDALFADGVNPYATIAKRLPGNKTLGQVFVDGAPLAQLSDEERVRSIPGTWCAIDGGKTLLVHFPPSPLPFEKRTIEVTVRNRIFAPHRRGLGYITVRGFVFEHCANQFPTGFWERKGEPQQGALSTRSGHHWIIENNIIRHATSLGLDCGSEGARDAEGNQPTPDESDVGYHLIRANTVSDNGACGIAGWNHTGTQIIGNVIERNNNLGWTAPETGGIKVHGFWNGTIVGNLLRDNDAFGIWLDNVWYGSRVSRNVCINNQGAGIFVEMGDGACLVDNNICAYTRNGEGIYAHDSSGVTFAHNLLYGNAHFGIYLRTVTKRYVLTEDRKGATVATSRNRILNNVFVDNYRGNICMPAQSERDKDNLSDYNLFIGGTQWHWEGIARHPFAIVREEKMLSLDEWRARTGQDAHSVTPAMKGGTVENGAVEKGGAFLSAQGARFDLQDGALLRVLQCPPVAGVSHDFYGENLSAEKVLPGPFQNPADGEATFPLWPVQAREELKP